MTSLITIGVVFIFLVFILRVWRKRLNIPEWITRVGEIITFFIVLFAFVFGEAIPTLWRPIIGSVVVVIFIVTVILSRIFRPNVIIQKDSLRFYKYPYIESLNQTDTLRPNRAYADITVENIGRIKARECEVEITLRNGKTYDRVKIVSTVSTPGNPNQMKVSIDGYGGKVTFCPLCLKLDTLGTCLPQYAVDAGVLGGTPISPDSYEVSARALYDGKPSKLVALGKVRIPDDLVNAKLHSNVQTTTIDEGGFVVYAELYQGKIRAKFSRKTSDDDIKRMVLVLRKEFPRLDNEIDVENEKKRRWEIVSGDIGGTIPVVIDLIDME